MCMCVCHYPFPNKQHSVWYTGNCELMESTAFQRGGGLKSSRFENRWERKNKTSHKVTHPHTQWIIYLASRSPVGLHWSLSAKVSESAVLSPCAAPWLSPTSKERSFMSCCFSKQHSVLYPSKHCPQVLFFWFQIKMKLAPLRL